MEFNLIYIGINRIHTGIEQSSYQNGDVIYMEIEELIKKIDAKSLREEAKKRDIPTRCVTKLNLAKALPNDVVEELAKKSGK